jgi:hypothetical protein
VTLEALWLLRPCETGQVHDGIVDESVHVRPDPDPERRGRRGPRVMLHGTIMPERE